MQTSADSQSGQRQVSCMTDENSETWSPFGISKVRSRPESLVADCSLCAYPGCSVGMEQSATKDIARSSGVKIRPEVVVATSVTRVVLLFVDNGFSEVGRHIHN